MIISNNKTINKILKHYIDNDQFININKFVNLDLENYSDADLTTLGTLPHYKHKFYFLIGNNYEIFYIMSVKGRGSFITKNIDIYSFFQNPNYDNQYIIPFAKEWYLNIRRIFYATEFDSVKITFEINNLYNKYYIFGEVKERADANDFIILQNKNLILTTNYLNNYIFNKANDINYLKTAEEQYYRSILQLLSTEQFIKILNKLKYKLKPVRTLLYSSILLKELE